MDVESIRLNLWRRLNCLTEWNKTWNLFFYYLLVLIDRFHRLIVIVDLYCIMQEEEEKKKKKKTNNISLDVKKEGKKKFNNQKQLKQQHDYDRLIEDASSHL